LIVLILRIAIWTDEAACGAAATLTELGIVVEMPYGSTKLIRLPDGLKKEERVAVVVAAFTDERFSSTDDVLFDVTQFAMTFIPHCIAFDLLRSHTALMQPHLLELATTLLKRSRNTDDVCSPKL
jgi:hypothetical protein